MSEDGKEITEYDTPGELVIRSPSVVLGYLNNEKATKETFENGWMRTGDEAVVRLGPKKTEHVFIVDRIKELIKVKVHVCPTGVGIFTDFSGNASCTSRARSPSSNTSHGG